MWTKLLPVALTIPMLLAGCSGGPASSPQTSPGPKAEHGSGGDDAKIQANLAKLSPEDRKLAEDQKYCANETDSRLGSMGEPVKVMVKDQPVFLCCKNCKADALAHPDETLAKVKELKAHNQGTARQ
jgi:hypothetical protein